MMLAPTPVLALRFHVWDLEPRHFFYFEGAQHIWQKLKTRAEFDKAKAECLKGPYADWEMAFKHGLGPAFLEKLRKHEKRDEITLCFDLQQAFNAFIKYYNAWGHQPLEWNDDSNATACQIAGASNVFTGRCDDAPDWRSAKQLKRHQGKVARILRRRGQDLEAVESLLEAIRNGS